MTAKQYWQSTTALPIVVPVASLPLLHLVSGTRLDVLSPVFALLSVSLLVGGIPYVVVAATLLYVLRHQDADAYRRLSFVAPSAFAALLFVALSVYVFYVFFGNTPGGDPAAAVGAFYAAFAIPVGYLYVGLAHAAYWLLVRSGHVTSRGRRPTSRSPRRQKESS